jgi:hypothetical protein
MKDDDDKLEDLLRMLFEEHVEEAYQEALELSDEEVRVRLRARGYDLRVVEAEAQVFYRRLPGKRRPPPN